jgi:hypothetical protein
MPSDEAASSTDDTMPRSAMHPQCMLPLPEPTMEGQIQFPPGITSMKQWGDTVLSFGKFKGQSYEDIIPRTGPGGLSYMVKDFASFITSYKLLADASSSSGSPMHPDTTRPREFKMENINKWALWVRQKWSQVSQLEFLTLEDFEKGYNEGHLHIVLELVHEGNPNLDGSRGCSMRSALYGACDCWGGAYGTGLIVKFKSKGQVTVQDKLGKGLCILGWKACFKEEKGTVLDLVQP